METPTRRHMLAGLIASAVMPCPAFAKPTPVRLGGTGAALGGLELLKDSFGTQFPETPIEILPSLGSGGGIRALSEQAIDVAFSARPLKDKEAALGLSAQIYAKTPLALIANRDVPINSLSKNDLVKLYDGTVTTWDNGLQARVITRPPSETDVVLVKAMSPEMAAAVDTLMQRPGLLVARNDQQNVDMVENTPGSIGVATLAQIHSERRPVKILALDGVKPQATLASNADNSFIKTFSFVTRADLSKDAGTFLAFLQSKPGQEILAASGHFPVSTS